MRFSHVSNENVETLSFVYSSMQKFGGANAAVNDGQKPPQKSVYARRSLQLH